MNDDITLNILVIALLILANAFFVAAEYAIVRVRRTKIEQLIAEGVRAATVVRHSLEQMDRYISATQVGVTLASLALGAVGEPFIAERVKTIFDLIFTKDHLPIWEHGVATAIALFSITCVHVVVGEIMPKSISLQFPEKIAMYVARPMQLCLAVFRPLIAIRCTERSTTDDHSACDCAGAAAGERGENGTGDRDAKPRDEDGGADRQDRPDRGYRRPCRRRRLWPLPRRPCHCS